MKKLLCSLLVLFSIVGCGVTHHSQSGGKEDVSYIAVMRSGGTYPKVTLEVDGTVFPIKKLYKTKDYQKVSPVLVSPGKHRVKVMSAGKVIQEESIYVGLQETYKIVLR